MIRRTLLAALMLLTALAGPVTAQTVMPEPRIQFFDNSGNVLGGGKLYAYAAGTTTPQNTYTTSALSVPNPNPVILDSAGRATVYLDSTLSYKFELHTSADVPLWTQDNISGQFSGVITISAADTRGLRITRASADAGMSISSTGGSGKSYALVSNTSGEFRIQDDADGTPRMQWAGDNLSAILTGTFTVSGGLFSTTGFGLHTIAASGTGSNRLQIRNSTNCTTCFSGIELGADAGAQSGRFLFMSSGWTPTNFFLADAFVMSNDRAGGISMAVTEATADIRFYTAVNPAVASMTVDQAGVTSITTLQPTTARSGSAQPGFLAYRTTNATVADGVTIVFPTEAYDTAANYDAGTGVFTAPITGIYQLCFNISYGNASIPSTAGVVLLVGGNSYQATIFSDVAGDRHLSACHFISMTAAQTAEVQAEDGGSGFGVSVRGTARRDSSFTGRLMP